MKLNKLFSSLLLGAVCALGTACLDDSGSGSGSSTAASTVGQRYLVAYTNSAGKAAVAQAGTIARDLPAHGLVSADLPAAALNGLRNHPGIEYIEEDVKRYPLQAIPEEQGLPSISQEVIPYGIPMVQADQIIEGPSDRSLCIIDSGIQQAHFDHVDNALTGTDDPEGTGAWNTDENHHGTHVAGTIIGNSNDQGVIGVNPGGTLPVHIIKVFDATAWAYSSTLIAALTACEDAGADIVSMSLGGSMKSRSEDRAFAAADARGVLSIAAAGNDGNNRNSYPASYKSVVSVAAVDASSEKADFSQFNSQVELSAPGVAVLSSVPMNGGLAAELNIGGYVPSIPMEGSPAASIAVGPLLVDCDTGEATCTGATGNICLIERGTISFSDKVLACEAGGGVAAVIYNNVPGPLTGTLGDIETTIPSVGISDSQGADLQALVGTAGSLTLGLTHWSFYDGTSMATPHVSGVAALIWNNEDPNNLWTNDDIRNALATTAIDLGEAGRDNSYGYGLIQAKAALDYLETDTPPTCTPVCTDGCGESDTCGGTCDANVDTELCACFPIGNSCTDASECCSNKCKGRSGNQTCK